jgi:signal transduction histidine kinase
LPHDPGSLPYAFRDAAPTGHAPVSVLAGDLDGDGVDEQVRFVHGEDLSSYLDVSQLAEDRAYPVVIINTSRGGDLSGLCDVTGDGLPEVIWYEQPPETRRATLTVSQVCIEGGGAERRDLARVDVELGPSGSGKAHWNTTMFVVGAFDLDGNGTRESLACSMVAGHSRQPRGIWLLNWETGEVVWRRPTAGTVTGGWTVTDADVDGAPEIVGCVQSPGNVVAVGAWSDSVAYVMAFELDGSVRWWQRIGGSYCETSVAAVDLDRDGTVEVATSTASHARGDSLALRVAVWAGSDGRLVAATPSGVSVNEVAVAACREGPRLFAGWADGWLRRLRLEDGALVVEQEINCGEGVEHVAVADFGPAVSGAAVVASFTSGSVAAFDERLTPLAFLPVRDGALRPTLPVICPARLRVAAGVVRGVHSLSKSDHRVLYLARSPLPRPLKAAAVAAALIGVLAGVPVLRRGALALLRRWVLPRASRDAALDELLGALATASHGKLTATSTFRRLREQASMLTLYEGTPPTEFGERFREAVENGREVGLPRVREILARAVRLGLVPAASARLSRELRELDRVTSRPTDAVPSPGEAVALRDRLDRVLPAVTAELEAVKRAADLVRSTPLSKGIERAAAARGDDVAAAGAALSLPPAPPGAGPRVAGTAAEVVFIFDNLIGNAVRAVAGRPGAAVSVGLSTEPGFAVVTVEDNGKGIPEDGHAAVFEEGVSDRAGGGHGLSESRRILALRGGSIRIARSAPGEGTAFEVMFRVVS